jgi:hypothetical protein
MVVAAVVVQAVVGGLGRAPTVGVRSRDGRSMEFFNRQTMWIRPGPWDAGMTECTTLAHTRGALPCIPSMPTPYDGIMPVGIRQILSL